MVTVEYIMVAVGLLCLYDWDDSVNELQWANIVSVNDSINDLASVNLVSKYLGCTMFDQLYIT